MKTTIIESGVVVGTEVPQKRKVLHMCYLVDASGSMNTRDRSGKSKYQTAFEGINDEISEQKSVEDGVDVLMSVYEFDSNKHGTERITEHCFGTNVTKLNSLTGRGASGNTPLYQSLAHIIEIFLRKAANDEQVVIKIFTDGAHNCYWGKYGNPDECKKLIKEVQDNRKFTITFVGTQQDTAVAVRSLGIPVGNTYSYDGTSKGLESAFTASTNASLSVRAKYKKSKSLLDTTDFFDANPETNTNS